MELDRVDVVVKETGFSGVVRIDRPGTDPWIRVAGLADRRFGVPCAVDTRFGLASGTKTFTAVTVLALVADGTLALDTPVRRHLGVDLPLIDDGVTIEQLLAHRSGVGDYLDEGALDNIESFSLPVPAQQLATTEDYVVVLDGHPMVSPPGERFAYNNGGYVVLSLVAERAAGRPFPELVGTCVTGPAGMTDTGFFRSDSLPERTATGYLDDGSGRTNLFHLPLRGAGDGGAYSTVGDIHALWAALLDGRLLRAGQLEQMSTVRGMTASGRNGYGLGLWLPQSGDLLELEGADAGVSFRSTHDRTTGVTATVLSNTTDGTWPVAACIEQVLGWSPDGGG